MPALGQGRHPFGAVLVADIEAEVAALHQKFWHQEDGGTMFSSGLPER
ncbi:MAG: hypothetical protein IPJ08_11025 [Burkholderiales bacterium]|nr:hypothetical protein [Burkholderiales bacterium]